MSRNASRGNFRAVLQTMEDSPEMKTINPGTISDDEYRIADELKALGLMGHQASVLAHIRNIKEIKSITIEKETGLRQPEVSLAMTRLKERGWLNERTEKNPGKGRPVKIYSLKIKFSEIVLQLEEEQNKQIEETRKKIEHLKKVK